MGCITDYNDNIFICSQSTNTIYKLSSNGEFIMTFSGSGVNGPWGCTIDGQNNVLIANFNNGIDDSFAMSYFTNDGIAISPINGYTLDTGGDQVLLSNGIPLYGIDGPSCYKPLMKQTGVLVDCAGNVWLTNNWKPNFKVDITQNPGGDSIIVFVGLAYPVLNNLK